MATRTTTIEVVRQIQAELERVLSKAADLPSSAPEPRVDILRTESHVCLLIELPQLSPSDIEATVQGNTVSIVAEKRPPKPTDGAAQFLRVERQWGRLERTIELPPAALNTLEAKATLVDGLLRIDFPIVEDNRNRPHRLTITSGEGEDS